MVSQKQALLSWQTQRAQALERDLEAERDALDMARVELLLILLSFRL